MKHKGKKTFNILKCVIPLIVLIHLKRGYKSKPNHNPFDI